MTSKALHSATSSQESAGGPYALRLAGWPDTRPVWTFSCPCQAHSTATHGRRIATDWWPEQRRLVIASLPNVFFGEQVAAAADWFDGLCDDVEAVGYEIGAAILPAVSIGADHLRPRIYFVGDTYRHGESRRPVHAEASGVSGYRCVAGDVVPTNGIPDDVGILRGFGNAIVPPLAAEVIKAYCEVRGL
jgi:DNA (cytosine-5)-methyltransferase 1